MRGQCINVLTRACVLRYQGKTVPLSALYKIVYKKVHKSRALTNGFNLLTKMQGSPDASQPTDAQPNRT